MAFNELIKSFDNIRQMMRDFYVFFFQNKLEVTAVKKLKKAKNKFVRMLAK